MAETIAQLTDLISIRQFVNNKGDTVVYFSRPDNKAASTASVLRYAVEHDLSCNHMLQMITPASTAGRSQGEALNLDAVCKKLSELNKEAQVDALNRMSQEQARAIDLHLRGKKQTNRGPKMEPAKVIRNIMGTLRLDLHYRYTNEGQFVKIQTAHFPQTSNFEAIFEGSTI